MTFPNDVNDFAGSKDMTMTMAPKPEWQQERPLNSRKAAVAESQESCDMFGDLAQPKNFPGLHSNNNTESEEKDSAIFIKETGKVPGSKKRAKESCKGIMFVL